MTEDKRKSNIFAKTVEKTRISRGKYTCLIKEAFSIKVFMPADTDVSKKIHGSNPTNKNTE